jgi:hypothetical protein
VRDGALWYAYCSNNPVTNVDPSGLEWGTLTQMCNLPAYASDCQYFAATDALIHAGYTPRSDISNLSEYVHNARVNDDKSMEETLSDVFNAQVTRTAIPAGLSQSAFVTALDGRPGIAKFNLNNFWGIDTYANSDVHAVAVDGNSLMEPYVPRKGENNTIQDVQGTNGVLTSFSEEQGGWAFNVVLNNSLGANTSTTDTANTSTDLPSATPGYDSTSPSAGPDPNQ